VKTSLEPSLILPLRRSEHGLALNPSLRLSLRLCLVDEASPSANPKTKILGGSIADSEKKSEGRTAAGLAPHRAP
jgi:hypothetical protein